MFRLCGTAILATLSKPDDKIEKTERMSFVQKIESIGNLFSVK